MMATASTLSHQQLASTREKPRPLDGNSSCLPLCLDTHPSANTEHALHADVDGWPHGNVPGIFLLFLTIMMSAMMFPALAPTASVRFETRRQQTHSAMACSSLLSFLVGYL